MIDAKRIGELKSWLTFAKARIYLPDEDDRNARAELLAILSDYQAALPLLEAVRGAEVLAYVDDDPFFSDADNGHILRTAVVYRERSGG